MRYLGVWHRPRAQGLSYCSLLDPHHIQPQWIYLGSSFTGVCRSAQVPLPHQPLPHPQTHTHTPISIHLLRAFSATLPVPSVDMTPSVQPLPTPPASPPVKMKIALIMSSILLHPLILGANLYYKTSQSIVCFLGTGSSVCSLRTQQATFLA